MVIKRTIESLKERPHAERRGIAVLSALVTMLILLGAWGVFFIKNMHKVSAEIPYTDTSNTDASIQDLTASASSTVDIINSITQALSRSNASQYSSVDTTMQIGPSQVAAGDMPQEDTVPAGDAAAANLQAALQKK